MRLRHRTQFVWRVASINWKRLYTIEASIRSIEQQSRIAGASQRSLSQDDLVRLRADIQTLLRLQEDECALARLDERTLSPHAPKVWKT